MNNVAPAPPARSAKIAAHLDGFEGCYLVGWAYSPGSAHNCTISVADDSGREVAQGEASRDRLDLLTVGIGRTDFGFRIPVKNLGSVSPLHVYADGVELAGSPLSVGRGHFDGHLYVYDGFATGWTTERLEGFSPPHIDIVGANGEILASGQSRADTADGDPNFAPARFHIGLANLFGQSSLGLEARANGAVFAHTTCDLRLVGNLDAITPTHCAGWLYSPDSASLGPPRS